MGVGDIDVFSETEGANCTSFCVPKVMPSERCLSSQRLLKCSSSSWGALKGHRVGALLSPSTLELKNLATNKQ